MDIQVRYTGSVEQFQNLQKKRKQSSNLLYFFHMSQEIWREKKCVNIQGQDKDTEK